MPDSDLSDDSLVPDGLLPMWGAAEHGIMSTVTNQRLFVAN